MSKVNNHSETLNADDLWSFALAFYAYDDNKKSLLLLQDKGGVNVNLILFCFYLYTKGVLLGKDGIEYFVQENKSLDSLTQTLRQRRKQCKPSTSAPYKAPEAQQYQELLKQELEHERQQQILMLERFSKLVGTANTPIYKHCEAIGSKSISDVDAETDSVVSALEAVYSVESSILQHHFSNLGNALRRFVVKKQSE